MPALLVGPLVLWPGPAAWLAAVTALLGLLLFRAARVRAPAAGAGRQAGVGLGWLVGGVAGVVGLAALGAGLQAPGPVAHPGRAEAVYDADARVATRPLPDCSEAPPALRVLLEKGAHPRLDPAGRQLWFDAQVAAGTRQLHRLDLASGEVLCRTCDEPGSNLRPYPGRFGVVFETDRHASALRPTDTEVHFLRRLPSGRREPSRRLTRSPGPDDHALLAQGEGQLVWSRRRGRGYEVVTAAIRSAHGALRLGPETALVRGGAAWVAAAEWSPDARALVVVQGNPFAPLEARAIDFATGSSVVLARDAVPGAAAFNADGSRLVLAGSRRGRLAGRLPASVAASFASCAGRIERSGALYRHTSLRLGAPQAALPPLPVPGLDDWGAPTGLAVSADGARIYLGQRSDDGARERLVEIRRDCR